MAERRTDRGRAGICYGPNVVHSFTQPHAGNDPSKGAAYDEVADKRSWIAMKAFFDELFE